MGLSRDTFLVVVQVLLSYVFVTLLQNDFPINQFLNQALSGCVGLREKD